ncbi:MAG: hypothetical protein KF799_11525 [Bdellovibrionales bacterium]|nr:hypothetical protein [Bdellovibrionales bacterium]
MKKFIVLLSMMMSTAACNHGAGSYSILADGQTFYQNTASVDTKIDVMWVIDNSGSMASSQANLANNFSYFIQEFAGKGYDFQMAVTNTHAYLSGPLWTPFFNSNPRPAYFEGQSQEWISRWRDGAPTSWGGLGNSGVYLMNKNTPNLAQTFMVNATQGVGGQGDERSLDSMVAALTNQWNQGFKRNGSFLAVIILTDEDDFSNNSTKHYESYDRPLTPISDFVTFLDGFTGSSGNARKYNVSSISVPDQACLNSINNGAQKIGRRVREMSDATGGVKASICGDFSQELTLISQEIVKLSTQFYLGNARPIPSTIKIVINGSNVPHVDANPANDGGFYYNADANSVVFSGNWTPPQGAAINVTFDPVSVTF